MTPTPAASVKTPQAVKPLSPGFRIPSMFPKRSSTSRSLSVDSVTASSSSSATPAPGNASTTAPNSGTSTPVVPPPSTTPPAGATSSARATQKSKFRKSWIGKEKNYNFNAANDIMGIVMLEIQGAKDLPRLKNSTF